MTKSSNLKDLYARLKHGSGRILVIQTAFLGDVILLTPLLRAVKAEFPGSHLTSITIPQCRSIVEPFVDTAFTIDKRAKTDLRDQIAALEKQLSSDDYDIAIIPHRSIRSAVLAKRAGIPVRVGFDRGSGTVLHTHRIKYDQNYYEGSRNLQLLSALVESDFDPLPSLIIPESTAEKVNLLLSDLGLEGRKLLAIAPGSVWKTKAWPTEKYRELSKTLFDRFGIHTIAVGARSDFDACDKSVHIPQYNLAGQLEVLETAALFSRVGLVISGDSAPAHIATAVKTRQLIIFGSTTPRFGFNPPTQIARIIGVDLWCRPCNDHGRRGCPLKTMACLNRISPSEVIESVKDWLQDKN